MVAAAVRSASKRVAAGFDRLRPPPDGVTILIYHRVGARSDSSVDLPTSLFDEQMSMLAEQCRVLTLGQAAEELLTGPPPGEQRPTVVVTFDDGTADFVDEALPVLARHRVQATYYLATAFLEDQRPFPGGAAPMTWAAAREMVDSGLVEVGSHTHTHALLDRLPATGVADELDRSIDTIGERLGVTAEHFAYPKAVLGSPEAEAEVRSRFRTATIARTRPNPWGTTDLHRLTRSPVQVDDGLEYFVRKVHGGMRLEDDVRDLLNRWRYRTATG